MKISPAALLALLFPFCSAIAGEIERTPPPSLEPILSLVRTQPNFGQLMRAEINGLEKWTQGETLGLGPDVSAARQITRSAILGLIAHPETVIHNRERLTSVIGPEQAKKLELGALFLGLDGEKLAQLRSKVNFRDENGVASFRDQLDFIFDGAGFFEKGAEGSVFASQEPIPERNFLEQPDRNRSRGSARSGWDRKTAVPATGGVDRGFLVAAIASQIRDAAGEPSGWDMFLPRKLVEKRTLGALKRLLRSDADGSMPAAMIPAIAALQDAVKALAIACPTRWLLKRDIRMLANEIQFGAEKYDSLPDVAEAIRGSARKASRISYKENDKLDPFDLLAPDYLRYVQVRPD